ncbi:uncharacterized protein LOC143908962 [Arctopsyche grandis]|uniref:uncharacterized protein LOC143908962 n=1 Tax=Arctopsyche grandis TaxID=121162 RepID=UPI00406D94C5
MVGKVFVVYLILICSIILAVENGNLGNCFGNGKTSCDKNRALIGGEYYECRVLKRFDNMPKRVVFNKGIFLRLDNGIFEYDENTFELISNKFKMPRVLKTIQHSDKRFTGGAGKASVKFGDEEDSVDIVTTGDNSFDQIEFHKKLNRLFILSHEIKKSKKDALGSLYTVDVENLILADNVLLAEKVEDVEQKFSSMAINPNKDMLLLTGQDDLGGKLMTLSLTKGDPCEIHKKIGKLILVEPENIPKFTGDHKEDFIKIIKEAEDKLTKLLEKFVASSPGTVDSTPKVKTLENQISRLKNDLETAMKKMNMWRSKLMPLSASLYQSAHQRVATIYKPNDNYYNSNVFYSPPQMTQISQLYPIPLPPPPPPPQSIMGSQQLKEPSHESKLPQSLKSYPEIILQPPILYPQSGGNNNPETCIPKWKVDMLKSNLDFCEKSKMDMSSEIRNLVFDDDTSFDPNSIMPELKNSSYNPPIVKQVDSFKTTDSEMESEIVNTTESDYVDYII